MNTTDNPSPELERLFEFQREMQSRVDHTVSVDNYRYVAGADLTENDDMFVGCFVVVDCENDNQVIYSKCTEMTIDVPYYSSLLFLREGPVVLALYQEFHEAHPDIKIDVILTDGSGEWHPRGFGLACYVGVQLQIPTIGVFKKFLYIGSEHNRKDVVEQARQSCVNVGDAHIIKHKFDNGFEVSCAVMKTTNNDSFRPIYVTPGNLINLESSIKIIKKLCNFREPEPIRLADRISREYIRNKKAQP